MRRSGKIALLLYARAEAGGAVSLPEGGIPVHFYRYVRLPKRAGGTNCRANRAGDAPRLQRVKEVLFVCFEPSDCIYYKTLL